ncbi:universal stress protein [Rhodovibrionaceae bacterium A322]
MSDSSDSQTVNPTERRVFLVVVDDTHEMTVALRFACRRARHTKGHVALLHVIEPSDYQNWLTVGDLMREEARNEAEALLQRVAAKVTKEVGSLPILFLREGNCKDELFQLIDEEPQVSILVLGASTEKGGPGPLVAALTGKDVGRLHIPVTIVPGNLTDDDVDALS